MKTGFRSFLLLVMLITMISISSPSLATAQTPEPPEILENGEFPSKLEQVEQTIRDLNAENDLNAQITWWSISGTTFIPSSSLVTYNYGGDGCVDTGNVFDNWRGSVNLPHGSTINGMWFNYDNEVVDPVDSVIYLRRYSYSGSWDDIVQVNGVYTGTGNKSAYGVATQFEVVDNFTYSYVLVWVGQPTQNLCGVNLSFTPLPFYAVALPLVEK